MAKEIERKFLVRGDAWRSSAKGTTYRQCYLNSAKERTGTADMAGLAAGSTRSRMTQNGPHPTVVAWNWSIATNRLVRPAAIGSTPQRG
jgi:hypothetical protein